jgi:hypothetical protein
MIYGKIDGYSDPQRKNSSFPFPAFDVLIRTLSYLDKNVTMVL